MDLAYLFWGLPWVTLAGWQLVATLQQGSLFASWRVWGEKHQLAEDRPLTWRDPLSMFLAEWLLCPFCKAHACCLLCAGGWLLLMPELSWPAALIVWLLLGLSGTRLTTLLYHWLDEEEEVFQRREILEESADEQGTHV